MIEDVLQNKEKTISRQPAKPSIKSRYFIELQVAFDSEAPRFLQDQLRRHSAIEFVRVIGEWLKDNAMEADVSSLSVTALGQVMIVCTRPVIDLIREQDIWAIAHIRSSDQFDENSLLKRASEVRK
ncbi:MAG TPA: hypothetical protein VHB73_05055 [Alphaproteobacteria bacterium]|nr:hypothetical protein [Alphaproteobacteria bacterium]